MSYKGFFVSTCLSTWVVDVDKLSTSKKKGMLTMLTNCNTLIFSELQG